MVVTLVLRSEGRGRHCCDDCNTVDVGSFLDQGDASCMGVGGGGTAVMIAILLMLSHSWTRVTHRARGGGGGGGDCCDECNTVDVVSFMDQGDASCRGGRGGGGLL